MLATLLSKKLAAGSADRHLDRPRRERLPRPRRRGELDRQGDASAPLTLGTRRLAPVLASITSTSESHIATQGAYAVFVLMAIDAVFPAASELVMLYAGAVAAGVFPAAHHVSLFGAKIGFGDRRVHRDGARRHARLFRRRAHRLVDRAARRAAAARAPRPLAPPHAGAARPRRALVRALGELRRARRPRDAARAVVRLDPGGRLRDAARAVRAATRSSARRSGRSRSPASATASARATSASTTASSTRSTRSWQAFSCSRRISSID